LEPFVKCINEALWPKIVTLDEKMELLERLKEVIGLSIKTRFVGNAIFADWFSATSIFKN